MGMGRDEEDGAYGDCNHLCDDCTDYDCSENPEYESLEEES